MSAFKKDMAAEKVLGEFLSDQYFKINIKATRITDKAIQLKGVDLIIDGENGLTYKVDEKAQLHYLNKDLPTFALEIDYLKDGKLKNGWLYDHTKICEYYAFVFSIHLMAGQLELNGAADIKSCEVVFVNRLRLLNELSKMGLDKKICSEHSAQLRKAEDGAFKILHRSGSNFQRSDHLAERPVNLIVRKKFLVSIGQQYLFTA